jgi:F420-0:gamma-glutamyl ligase
MQVRPVRTRVYKEGENLETFIAEHLSGVPNGSILTVTSKIVALSEGRTADISEKQRLIASESDYAKETKYVTLTIKDGMVMPNAGIDDSNADGKIILLPKDSFAAAEKLRTALQLRYGIEKLGILITDSRVMPLRAGVVGVALGYAGFCGIRDYRGTPDIFGRTMEITQTNIADSLATAATLVMGEGGEQQPLAVVTEAPVQWNERIDKKELIMDSEDDMYGPLFTA